MPRVSLIEGPEGVGKRLVAREAAEGVARGTDLIEVGVSVCTTSVGESRGHRCARDSSCSAMSRRVAEYVSERCSVRPLGGSRVVLFDAGMASAEALNAMLKLLEEPPRRTHFVCWASRPVLPTIRSRAECLSVHPLEDGEVERLLSSWGVGAEVLARAVELAAGRPGRGLRASSMLKSRGTVVQMLRACVVEDRALLMNCLAGLEPNGEEEWAEYRSGGVTERGRATAELMALALGEARSGNYRCMEEAELTGVVDFDTRYVDMAIRRLGEGSASPVLAVRSACEVLVAESAAVRRGVR